MTQEHINQALSLFILGNCQHVTISSLFKTQNIARTNYSLFSIATSSIFYSSLRLSESNVVFFDIVPVFVPPQAAFHFSFSHTSAQTQLNIKFLVWG